MRKTCGRWGGMTTITNAILQHMELTYLANLLQKKDKTLKLTQITALTFLVLHSLLNTNKKWVGSIGITDTGRVFWGYTRFGRQSDGRRGSN
jgi:hypothetical protein